MYIVRVHCPWRAITLAVNRRIANIPLQQFAASRVMLSRTSFMLRRLHTRRSLAYSTNWRILLHIIMTVLRSIHALHTWLIERSVAHVERHCAGKVCEMMDAPLLKWKV